MNGTVEMFRNAADRNRRDRFSCPLAAWQLFGELGRTFGWQPQGTTYRVPQKSKVEMPARRDYQPGDALDHKQVTADDAMAWARALETAKRSPHFSAMLAARSAAEGADQSARMLSVLDEFIEFAYGGAFTFAVAAITDGNDAK